MILTWHKTFILEISDEISNRKDAKEFVKQVAICNGDLKDKEIRFMVRLKKAWGRHLFDS